MYNNILIEKSKMLIIFYITIIMFISTFIFVPDVVQYFLLGLSLILGIYLSIKRNKNTMLFLIIYFVLQNFILIVFARYLNKLSTSYILVYKEAFIYFCTFISIMFKGNYRVLSKNIFITFYIIILFIGLITSHSSFSAKIVSFRQLMIPAILFLFGVSLKLNQVNFKQIINWLIRVGIIITVLGYIERFLIARETWVTIGYNQYMQNKGFDIMIFTDFFISYDYLKIFNSGIRRMASIFVDPIALGHFLVLVFICIIFSDMFYKHNIKKVLSATIVLGAIILALSKGAFLVLAFTIIFYLVFNANIKIIKPVALVSIMALIFYFSINYKNLGNAAAHVSGIISSFNNMKLFGYGIGSSGNLASVFSDDITGLGSENYIGSLLAQTGVLGLIIFLIFNIKIIFDTLRLNKYRKDKFYYSIIALVVSLLIESFMSESSITVIGSGLYYIFIGIIYKQLSLERGKNEKESYAYRLFGQ